MAKAKLTSLTKQWIAGKSEGENPTKRGRPDLNASSHKTRRTIYISDDAAKLLWYNRAETGQTLSDAIEKLVFARFQKKPELELTSKSK